MSIPSGQKVLVAMSGGVDSSVAAALLVRAGYDVVGCFMRLGSPGESLEEEACADEPGSESRATRTKIGHQGCCSVSDAADARMVAAELGVPFYVLNFKRDFARVMDYFADEYSAGRTPNPCVRCNDWLKFGRLHEEAERIGAGAVASGHYARVRAGGRANEGPRLLRGLDRAKDQSYVLFGVGRAQLGRMLLPIGEMEKGRVRELAERWGLPVFDKPDSQEICFVPGDDYAAVVEARRPWVRSAAGGAVVDEAGKRVGTHGGQHRYTIGQRRGVGLALGYPVYVVGKDAATNTVTVGGRERLLVGGCTAGEANWLASEEELGGGGWFECAARYRAHGEDSRARARLIEDGQGGTPSGRRGRFEVEFVQPQEAVAPGQAIVLYSAREPDVVLGGGWIERASPPA